MLPREMGGTNWWEGTNLLSTGPTYMVTLVVNRVLGQVPCHFSIVPWHPSSLFWWLPHKKWSSPKRVLFFSRVTEALRFASRPIRCLPSLAFACLRKLRQVATLEEEPPAEEATWKSQVAMFRSPLQGPPPFLGCEFRE